MADSKSASIRVPPDVRGLIQTNGGHCPFCGASGKDVWETDSYSGDQGTDSRKECGNCGAAWTETRTIKSVDVDRYPDGDPMPKPPTPGSPLAKVMKSGARMVREAAPWKNLPKGWTEDSVKKFWDSLTSRAPKHKVTECIKQMENSGMDDPGAFCGSLADKVDPGWRSRAASSPRVAYRFLTRD